MYNFELFFFIICNRIMRYVRVRVCEFAAVICMYSCGLRVRNGSKSDAKTQRKLQFSFSSGEKQLMHDINI